MTPTLPLIIASIVAFLQFAAHSFLFVFAKPANGPEEIAVIEQMKAHRFKFVNSMRSYWEMYFGYGLQAAFFCLLEAILFFIFVTVPSSEFHIIQPIIIVFFIANLGHIFLARKYFFITPIIPDVIIAICLALSVVTAAA